MRLTLRAAIVGIHNCDMERGVNPPPLPPPDSAAEEEMFLTGLLAPDPGWSGLRHT